MRQSWETMTSVSAGHIILTPTQPVGIEPGTSWPGVARSTDWATAPPTRRGNIDVYSVIHTITGTRENKKASAWQAARALTLHPNDGG